MAAGYGNGTTVPPVDNSYSVYVALGLLRLSAGIGSLGILTNGLALIIIFAFTKMWKKINFFLLVNQIAVDFVTCLIIMAQYSSIINGDPNVRMFQLKITNNDLCRFWFSKAFMWSMILSSNYNIVLVTFERYLKIVHPVFYHRYLNWVTNSYTKGN